MQKAGAGGSQVWEQLGDTSENLSQRKKKFEFQHTKHFKQKTYLKYLGREAEGRKEKRRERMQLGQWSDGLARTNPTLEKQKQEYRSSKSSLAIYSGIEDILSQKKRREEGEEGKGGKGRGGGKKCLKEKN